MLPSNKTAVFLTTRHFIPKFYFKINKTHAKDDLTVTPSITYCTENKTKIIMKLRINKFNTRNCFSF